MWCIGDTADGNDDDIFVANGWKSEFDDSDDDIFIVDWIALGKVLTFVVVVAGDGLPCKSWLMSFCGPVKV